MARPVDIRHDDMLGRLDDIERRMDEMEPKGKKASDRNAERARLEESYPVQMVAPGVFPPDPDHTPASETPAVIDSIRAKTEAELRAAQPLAPMDLPPTEQLQADAKAEAVESVAAERKILDAPEPKARARTESAKDDDEKAPAKKDTAKG